MSPRSWTSAARSDTGRVRDSNEDSLLDRPDAGLFAVADGMGGHAAGEVASRIAVEALEEALAGGDGGEDDDDGGGPPSGDRVAQAIRAANRRILEDADRNPERAGMGTTLTALALGEAGRWRIGHVGDSRAYVLREGALRQLTTDHSWVGRRVDAGELTKEEARRHPMSSVLERALGTAREVEVDVEEGEARPGDLYLLCSDGLTDTLPDAEIRSILREAEGLDAAADRLVHAANEAGGPDNVTVVLARVAS